jgi:hypothetical protein
VKVFFEGRSGRDGGGQGKKKGNMIVFFDYSE